MVDNLSEFQLSNKIRQKLKNKKLLQQEFAAGKTAQEILEFSDQTLAKFYQAAYFLLEHQRYRDAGNAFLFLATLNPHHHEYWLGLGMATQLCQDYEKQLSMPMNWQHYAIFPAQSPIFIWRSVSTQFTIGKVPCKLLN